jgi:hypothetical protein
MGQKRLDLEMRVGICRWSVGRSLRNLVRGDLRHGRPGKIGQYPCSSIHFS